MRTQSNPLGLDAETLEILNTLDAQKTAARDEEKAEAREGMLRFTNALSRLIDEGKAMFNPEAEPQNRADQMHALSALEEVERAIRNGHYHNVIAEKNLR
jgi:hypothetical protein